MIKPKRLWKARSRPRPAGRSAKPILDADVARLREIFGARAAAARPSLRASSICRMAAWTWSNINEGGKTGIKKSGSSATGGFVDAACASLMTTTGDATF